MSVTLTLAATLSASIDAKELGYAALGAGAAGVVASAAQLFRELTRFRARARSSRPDYSSAFEGSAGDPAEQVDAYSRGSGYEVSSGWLMHSAEAAQAQADAYASASPSEAVRRDEAARSALLIIDQIDVMRQRYSQRFRGD